MAWVLLLLLSSQEVLPDTERDAAITEAVEDFFLDHEWVPSYAIRVETQGGTVLLSGSVRTLLAKTEAERIASEVRGVTDVTNNLVVPS